MESLKQNLDIQKPSNTRKYKRKRKLIVSGLSRSLRKYRKIRAMSKELGIRYCTMLKWSRESNSDSERKKRKDALSIESAQKVRDFFVKPYISVNNPEKRKVGKDLKPKHFLNVSKKNAYQTFRKENQFVKVSESKFWALKPKHVVPLKKGKFRSCLCEKCINVEQCIQCIQRKCQTCGVKQLENHFHDLGVIANTDETVNWYQWETKKITEPKVSTRKVLASKSTYVKDLLQNLTEDMKEFSMHLFLANWQYRQFSNLKEKIPENVMVCIMDFAENFSTRYQDECQSAHWCYDQITIHPIVCYYSDALGKTVTHEVVYISNDLTHDANFVDHCFKNCVNFLRTKNLSPKQCIQFTDGCSSQYKSKVPFFDISSYAEELDGIQVERHFFGSGHGKGPADGCSGVVKSAITRGIIAGNVLSCAEDIFSFVTSDLTKDGDTFKRTFLLIDKKDVPRSRPLRSEAVTVPGTRQFHCVKAVAQGLIKTRRVSCTCAVCLDIEQGTCINNTYVDEWVEQTLTNDLRKLNQKSKSKKQKVCKRKGKLTHMEPALNHETVETHEECQIIEKHDTQIIETHAEPQIVESLDESQIVETHEEPQIEETHEECQIIDTHQEPAMNTLNSQIIETVEERDNQIIETINVISVDMRKAVFQYIYDDFQNASSFEELQLICTRHTDLIDEIPFLGSSCHSVISTAKTVDKLSLDIWPQDEPQNHIVKYPVCVKGDGNCLPRAGSVLANGNEDSHLEVRTRMIIEIVTHEDVYLDEYYLNRGTTGEDKHIVSNLVMYSDSYIAGDKMTPAVARRILREDTFNFAKLGAYGNAWLIFALSSILKCSLFAIYPQKGNPVVRSHLNREFCPRMTKSSDIVYLMWTSTRTKEMRDEHWIPNHFVPVLPLQNTDQEKGDNSLVENSHDSSISIDFDLDSFSLCSLELLVNPIDIDLMQPDPMAEVHPIVDEVKSVSCGEVVQPMADEVKSVSGGEVVQPIVDEVKSVSDGEVQPMADEDKSVSGGEVVQPMADEVKSVSGGEVVQPIVDEVNSVSHGDKAKPMADEVKSVSDGEVHPMADEVKSVSGEVVQPKADEVKSVSGGEVVQPILDGVKSVSDGDEAQPMADEVKSVSGGEVVQPMADEVKSVSGGEVVQPIVDEVKSVSDGDVQPMADEDKSVSGGEVVQPMADEVKSVSGGEVVQPIVDEVNSVSHGDKAKPMADEVKSVSDGEVQPMADEVKSVSGEVVQPKADEVKSVSGGEVVQPIVDEVKSVTDGEVQPMADEVKSVSGEVVQPKADEVKSVSGGEVVQPIVDEVKSVSDGGIDRQIASYPTGTYLCVSHGNDLFPVVVTDWPWILYFKQKKGNIWLSNETPYTCTAQDIVKDLPAPDIQMFGRSMGYIFRALSILQNGPMPRFLNEDILNDLFSSQDPQSCCIKKLRIGLDSLGIIKVGSILPMFVHLLRPSSTTLTLRSVIQLLKPKFSEEGSNCRLYENSLYSAYTKYLRAAASGRREAVSLQHVLQFVTGASEEPVLGFAQPLSIEFVKVREDLSFIPTANTCINCMMLPRPSLEIPLPSDEELFTLYDYAFLNTYYGLI